jgi:predicted dehydrogenase
MATLPQDTAGPGRYGIVGSGWRTGFFHRLAEAMPDRFTVTGVVTRTAERGQEVEREWRVPTFRSVGELVAADKPDFVIVSVPWEVAPVVTGELVALGIPVLSETPPAPDLDGLRRLWSTVGGSGLVQVAEQNPLLPLHAAQSALVRAGVLGEVTSVQMSSTHLYHAVAVMRMLLDAGLGPTTVDARKFVAPLADPVTRDGWSGSPEVKDATTTLATIDFGAGRVALYDFTDNQWHNPLRSNRIVIRGSQGELVDDHVVRLADPLTAVESRLHRRQTGINLNLEGFALDHISLDGQVLYRNPFPGVRLADEDISIASLLARTTAWSRGDGPPPYPLAEASQDHLLSLAIEESARIGRPVTTAAEPWSS